MTPDAAKRHQTSSKLQCAPVIVARDKIGRARTVSEFSRDLAPCVPRSWAGCCEAQATTGVAANEDVQPGSAPERPLSRKAIQIDLLRAAQEIVKQLSLRGASRRRRAIP